jgi:predicted ATP-grasp superfamily ATP-dependent carboligase
VTSEQKKLSVLLASAGASGTLASVRNLGMNGIDVQVVCSRPLGAAAWSRWASRSHKAPPETDSRRFIDRLLAIGMAQPGKILLATSDETAWLYSAHADELRQYFRLYQPSLDVINSILDKGLLAAAASKVGLQILPSWIPKTLAEVEALAPTLPYPLLIKPRTHVHRLRDSKGEVAYSRKSLVAEYEKFIKREQHSVPESLLPAANALPLLQPFVAVGSEGILSVTGFIDNAGKHFIARHAIKIFQRSKPVGVGVCFESAPPSGELDELVHRLCRQLGYFGIFEAEFIQFEGSWVLIDFNPRLFNQVGMDIRRGMPLPLMACLDAAEERLALESVFAKAQSQDADQRAVFADHFTLNAILSAQALTGRNTRQERAAWRRWAKENAPYAVDAAVDRADPLPGIIHAVSETYLGLRAFPRFLRTHSNRVKTLRPASLRRASS